MGTYSNTSSSTACTSCPLNTYNRLTRQTSKSACLSCANGKYSAVGSSKCSYLATVVAGNGISGSGTDGNAATSAYVSTPRGVVLDKSLNIYILDTGYCAVRKVTAATGILSCFAGCVSCQQNIANDNGAATSGALYSPVDLGMDVSGNLFVVDYGHHQIRMVDAVTNIMSTFAGNLNGNTFTAGSAGDGGAATSAYLNSPNSLALDASGNMYIVDAGNSRIRYV